jgi:positive regulator of sigma E activity
MCYPLNNYFKNSIRTVINFIIDVINAIIATKIAVALKNFLLLLLLSNILKTLYQKKRKKRNHWDTFILLTLKNKPSVRQTA